MIKNFFNFKTLITESVLKFLYIGLSILAVIATLIGIVGGWISAFAMMANDSVGMGLLTLIGSPIIGIIALAIYLFLFRLLFESVLILFLTYRELKEINSKTK